MNYRQRVQEISDIIPLPHRQSETKIIEGLVNRLLENLYIPIRDKKAVAFIVDKKKLEKYGLDNEDINWGDLSVEEVIKVDEDRFIVKIQEAGPDCPNLCEYIEGYMFAWGWDVKVETNW
ncbi:MAG: hypothetical protein AB1567_06940 [bacterium]